MASLPEADSQMWIIPRVPALALFAFSLSSFPGDFVNWQIPGFYLKLRSIFWNSNQYIELPSQHSPVNILQAFQTHPNLVYLLAQNDTTSHLSTMQKSGSHPWLLSFHHQHSISYQVLVSLTYCFWSLPQSLHPRNYCCRSILILGGELVYFFIFQLVLVLSINSVDIQ